MPLKSPVALDGKAIINCPTATSFDVSIEPRGIVNVDTFSPDVTEDWATTHTFTVTGTEYLIEEAYIKVTLPALSSRLTYVNAAGVRYLEAVRLKVDGVVFEEYTWGFAYAQYQMREPSETLATINDLIGQHHRADVNDFTKPLYIPLAFFFTRMKDQALAAALLGTLTIEVDTCDAEDIIKQRAALFLGATTVDNVSFTAPAMELVVNSIGVSDQIATKIPINIFESRIHTARARVDTYAVDGSGAVATVSIPAEWQPLRDLIVVTQYSDCTDSTDPYVSEAVTDVQVLYDGNVLAIGEQAKFDTLPPVFNDNPSFTGYLSFNFDGSDRSSISFANLDLQLTVPVTNTNATIGIYAVVDEVLHYESGNVLVLPVTH